MFRFHGVRKVGHTLQREDHSFRLEQSLVELFDLYDGLGGASPSAAAAIDANIERCLNDLRNPKALVQDRLYVLLRAKDMHRYLMEDDSLAAVKMAMLEHVLLQRTTEGRWAAVRKLLLGSLARICGGAESGGSALFEAFKRQASLRSSSLGKLLQTMALFNFDLDEEQPPVNLRLRFTRGAFPGHCWEVVANGGAATVQGGHWQWSPANPLCRWEYLAADLGHALFRSQGARAQSEPGAGAPAVQEAPEGVLYRATGGTAGGRAGGDQMELFPLEAATFVPELSREIHGTFGAEGVRLFALLMGRLSWGGAGQVLEISLTDLAAEPSGSAVPPKAIRERAKRLFAIVERLSQVKLVRIAKDGTQERAHASTLLTLLGEKTDLPQGGGARAWLSVEAGVEEEMPQAVRLVVDPCFYSGEGGNLGLPYRELPEVLLCLPPRTHPYALGLYVFCGRQWLAEWETAGGVLNRPARELLREAGFALKDNARYRAIEAMKRDLNFLQEQGYLGRWRLSRGTERDALDDVYRLEAPRRGNEAVCRSSATPSGAQVFA